MPQGLPVHENIVLTPHKQTQAELLMLEVGGSGSSEREMRENIFAIQDGFWVGFNFLIGLVSFRVHLMIFFKFKTILRITY